MPFGKNLKKNQAHGYSVVTSPVSSNVESETRSCVHCGQHWIYKQGSGIDRGLCTKCDGYTCGKKSCDPCYPIEARIEDMEKPSKKGHKSMHEDKLEALLNIKIEKNVEYNSDSGLYIPTKFSPPKT